MKKTSGIVILAMLIVLSACGGPKPYYETRTGKKKQKYYNDIQFGKNSHPKKTW